MNIVLITTESRPELLEQTLRSMKENAHDWGKHDLCVVVDSKHEGASACRNYGAAHALDRQDLLMFSDDDVYYTPCWDYLLQRTLQLLSSKAVVSGHSHPYNHSQGVYRIEECEMDAAQVLSTVHYVLPWAVWDAVGPFRLPGGPGGSEDVDWCARAAKLGYGFAVTRPMCAIHCGLTNSTGRQLVGYDLMMKQNDELVAAYGLTGKVVYS